MITLKASGSFAQVLLDLFRPGGKLNGASMMRLESGSEGLAAGAHLVTETGLKIEFPSTMCRRYKFAGEFVDPHEGTAGSVSPCKSRSDIGFLPGSKLMERRGAVVEKLEPIVLNAIERMRRNNTYFKRYFETFEIFNS